MAEPKEFVAIHAIKINGREVLPGERLGFLGAGDIDSLLAAGACRFDPEPVSAPAADAPPVAAEEAPASRPPPTTPSGRKRG